MELGLQRDYLLGQHRGGVGTPATSGETSLQKLRRFCEPVGGVRLIESRRRSRFWSSDARSGVAPDRLQC
jgi:hypothetical protein